MIFDDPYEMVLDFYDELYCPDKFREQTETIRTVVSLLFDKPGERIRLLDLCTGTGRMINLFCDNERFDLTGIDHNTKMLSVARGKYNGENIKFIEGDIKSLLDIFANGEKFHGILMAGGSIQLFDRDIRRRILGQIGELLIDGGVFVFDILTGFNPCIDQVSAKYDATKGERRVRIIYDRMPLEPPHSFRQYVYLIENDLSHNLQVSSAYVDIYCMTSESITAELEETGFTCARLETKKEHSEFIVAKRGASF